MYTIRPAGSWATIIICILQMRFSVRTGKKRERKACRWDLSRCAVLRIWYIGNFWDGHFLKYRKKRFNGYSLMQEGRGRPISGHRISSLNKDKYRLYYCVFQHSDVKLLYRTCRINFSRRAMDAKGCIVKTDDSTAMMLSIRAS